MEEDKRRQEKKRPSKHWMLTTGNIKGFEVNTHKSTIVLTIQRNKTVVLPS